MMRFVLMTVLLAACAPSPAGAEPAPRASSAALPAASVATTAEPTPVTLATPVSGFTFTGSGQQSTEVFELPAGDYLVAWTAQATDGHGCPYSITLEPIGHDEFTEVGAFDIAPQAELVNGSQTAHLDGGRYAFDIGGSCTWTVTIAPR